MGKEAVWKERTNPPQRSQRSESDRHSCSKVARSGAEMSMSTDPCFMNTLQFSSVKHLWMREIKQALEWLYLWVSHFFPTSGLDYCSQVLSGRSRLKCTCPVPSLPSLTADHWMQAMFLLTVENWCIKKAAKACISKYFCTRFIMRRILKMTVVYPNACKDT